MCGVAGAFCQPDGAGLVQTMADRIRHRGPDAEGMHVAEGVGLGHRRLSIIDLATGDQPLGNEGSNIA